MKDTQPARVCFGAFELDLKGGELRLTAATEGESRIVLAEQPFRLLVMLVEREGEIATREEIRKSFWPNDTIVEFDHSINVVIGKLRKALGDSADEPKYIETLARRGYRLMVPVEWLGTDGPSTPEAAPSFRAPLAKGACPEPAEGWDRPPFCSVRRFRTTACWRSSALEAWAWSTRPKTSSWAGRWR